MFHTMKKIVKMCQWYTDSFRFFLQATVTLDAKNKI
jgi:hypothetical protein